MHIDLDAFFVSVEQALNPELRGKPVGVGGRHREGVITSTVLGMALCPVTEV
ncbi:DNA polymerase IV [subsurface metagenome]